MQFIELENWGTSYKVAKETFNLELIDAILQPSESDSNDGSRCGCIIVSQGVRYPVKESYDRVIEIIGKMIQS